MIRIILIIADFSIHKSSYCSNFSTIYHQKVKFYDVLTIILLLKIRLLPIKVEKLIVFFFKREELAHQKELLLSMYLI